MINNLYKSKITDIIAKAKKKGVVNTYTKFAETKEGKDNQLAEDEIIYYTSKKKGETK